MHTRIIAAFVMLVVCGLAPQASAQEFCVTCKGPDAKYRCLIGGDASPAARTSRGQLLCISELARTGDHASCSVGRSTEEACEGELRTVMFPSTADPTAAPLAEPQPGGPAYPEAADPLAPQPPDPLAAGQPPPQAPAEAPPQTVEELAKQTVEASGKGLTKAGEAVGDTAESTGEAVGNAVSKTWKCMTSLFSDC
ncbi:MAG TPA: hypothetical protein VGA65_06795 [Hyphomicrobium sp.]